MKILFDQRFHRDFARWKKAGWDMRLLDQFIADAESSWPLPAKYEVHPLKGVLKGMWDAHIRENWVVLFAKDKDTIVLLQTGTHGYLGLS